MTVRNPWVGYLDRSYLLIKRSILDRLGQNVPEITDHSDSNILVVVIEAFSGVAEMLNYYIDNMAREAFITTCRRYSSAVKHTRLIDYRIKAALPASVDITITFKDGEDDFALVDDTIIPSGIIFSGEFNPNIIFINTNDKLVRAGSKSVNLSCSQKTLVTNDELGVTSNTPDQIFLLPTNYVHNSSDLTIGGVYWERRDTLGLSNATDKHYIVEVSSNQEPFIKFGDGINGAIPNPGLSVVANYYTTFGEEGNLEIGSITQSDFDWTSLGIPSVLINNSLRAVSGTGVEDLERIRRSAPLSIRTLNRAVTEQDYEDIAILCPGVDKAKVFFNCGKYVYIYIAPVLGGIASSGLIQTLEDYFYDKKMITTFVKGRPCGESYIYINLNVVGRFRVDGPILRNELLELLTTKYSYDNSDINMSVRISDLYALVDNYYKVDYLTLNAISLKPYIRPLGNNSVEINHEINIRPGSVNRLSWKIKYNGLHMIILRNNVQVANLLIGEQYIDLNNIMDLTILPGAYVIGMEWEFKTLPYNRDIILDDYSIPILKAENIDLIVTEQLT